MVGPRVNRSVRVATLLKEELASIISRDLKDPGLEMVTLTHVKLSRDMRSGEVYYSAIGGEERVVRAGKILNKASGYLKGELSRRLRMKRVPDLTFKYDDSYDRGMKIDRIIKEITGDE